MSRSVALRRANLADAELLFRWANDPSTRAVSFDARPIAWATHVEWLGRRLADPSTLLLVGEDEGARPVGQVRFDRSDTDAAVISVSVDGSRRGGGFGRRLIAAASSYVQAEWALDRVIAFIKPGNHASIAAFVAAGYAPAGAPRTDAGRLTYEYRFRSERGNPS